ncbi:MAG: SlyX family protein [Pseudomonadota bacterium]
MEDRMTRIEERLADALRLADELSDTVADQAKRIIALEAQVAALMDLARDASADGGSHAFADEPPPHY